MWQRIAQAFGQKLSEKFREKAAATDSLYFSLSVAAVCLLLVLIVGG
jgi:hypothetical protein